MNSDDHNGKRGSESMCSANYKNDNCYSGVHVITSGKRAEYDLPVAFALCETIIDWLTKEESKKNGEDSRNLTKSVFAQILDTIGQVLSYLEDVSYSANDQKFSNCFGMH